MVYLGSVSGSRDNNFNLIRMVAALAVLVSHAWPIALGPAVPEPLEPWIGRSLGWVAVAVFFAISGFLIARSWHHAASPADWAAARVLRLFPALAVVLALTVLVLGPALTRLPLEAYAADPATASYWPRNMALVPLQYPLPGVFDDNPYGPAINGSLWTLRHEVACYLGVALLGLAGALARPRLAAAALAAYAVAHAGLRLAAAADLIVLPGLALPFLKLSLPFAIGVAFWVWRDRLALSWAALAGLAGLALLLRPTALFEPALMAALAYGTFCLAYLPGGRLRAYNRAGDLSYGVYIYAFPVQQTAVAVLGPMAPAENIALALPPTLALAWLSWHLVERPALDLKRRFRRRRAA